MIAKIGRGKNLTGVLTYNQLKVEQENGKVLLAHNIVESLNGYYSVAQLAQSFAPYLIANRNTQYHTLHISLNPDPKDKVSDKKFREMAEEYMREMGYGQQPFVVFKHTDIDRTHIHIVSVCVDETGKKISDKFEKIRSMNVCRDLEKKHGLIPATDKEHRQNDKIFRPVNYRAGDIKSQIASIVRYLPKYYRFQSLGTYNALLFLFNIRAEEVSGELHGKSRQGLVYFALNEQGEKVSNPFKASLFGKGAGFVQLQKHFMESKEQMKSNPARILLKNTIETTMHIASDETGFKKQLTKQGINTVVRRNNEGRIYGMTFINHESQTVWNGSQLGKNLSANVFNDWWSEQNTEKRNAVSHDKIPVVNKDNPVGENEQPHELFDFLTRISTIDDSGVIEGFGGLLPEVYGQDYEEQAFINQMKKKKKHKKKQ